MRNIALLFFGLTLAGCVHGSTCLSTTLDAYLVPGFSCDIGAFKVTDFVFGAISGNTVSILDTDITVTPSYNSLQMQAELSFASGKFTVTGSQAAHYAIAYLLDPPDVRSMADVLSDPTLGGKTTVTTLGCEEAAFTGTLDAPICSTTVRTLKVFDDGTLASIFSTSYSFSPPLSPGILGIYNRFEVDANGGSANLRSLSNQSIGSPEPSTLLGGLAGVALAFYAGRLKRR
jgi:hypothetical protein